jgi:DNA-binding NtrC family response regulator
MTQIVYYPKERAMNNTSGLRAHILIIYDEFYLASALSLILNEAEYKTTICTSGGDALTLFSKQGGYIDLVVLDNSMSDMEGKEIIRKLKRINPDVKTVICSGYDLTAGFPDLEESASAFLQKPFLAKELLKSIANLL